MTTPFPSSYWTMWCSPHFGSALCPDRGPDEYPVHSVGRIARLARMTTEITRINPDQLHPTPGCHHITVVEAGRTAFLAGQCPLDRSGTLVGPGDLDAQIDQVAANALAALSTVGARPDQVVRSVIYVVRRQCRDPGRRLATPHPFGHRARVHHREHTAGHRAARLSRAADRGRPHGGTTHLTTGRRRRGGGHQPVDQDAQTADARPRRLPTPP